MKVIYWTLDFVWYSAKWNNQVLKVVLGFNVSAQNYKTMYVLFCNRSDWQHFVRVSGHIPTCFPPLKRNSTPRKWPIMKSQNYPLPPPPPTHHTQTHPMINLTLSIAFPFWSIKVAVGTWRDCIIYFTNNFQNEWKLFVYCSSETKDGIMLTTPSMHLRY